MERVSFPCFRRRLLGVSIRWAKWEFVAGVGVGSEWSGLKSVCVGVDCWQCSGRIWQRRYPWVTTISRSPFAVRQNLAPQLERRPVPVRLLPSSDYRTCKARTASYTKRHRASAHPDEPDKPPTTAPATCSTRLEDMHERLPRRAPSSSSCARARNCDCNCDCDSCTHSCNYNSRHVSATGGAPSSCPACECRLRAPQIGCGEQRL